MDLKILEGKTEIPFVSSFRIIAQKETDQVVLKCRRQAMEDYISSLKSSEHQAFQTIYKDWRIAERVSNFVCDLSEVNLPETDAETLIFVNGFYDSELSTLDQSLFRNDFPCEFFKKDMMPFVFLNRAYQDHPVSIAVHNDLKLRVIFLSEEDRTLCLPCLNIHIKKGVNFQLEEIHYAKEKHHQSHLNLHLSVDEEAQVSHRLSVQGDTQISVAHFVSVSQGASYSLDLDYFSAQSFSYFQNIELGEKSACRVSGRFPKYENVEWVSDVYHKGNASASDLKIRAVGYDQSLMRVTLNTFAREGVKDVKIQQSLKGLYLDEQATFILTPNMLITGETTEGYHGATMEKLSQDVLFYLRSRGISEVDSQDMLIHSFLS
ncbi:MAG: SufD family Fe-S cluster assembly protein [Alphaproteobacteria bacterium]|nr:SufD family Fe-S cluster assembly protein [Alphaproteobacteria bacterium]